MVPDKVTRTMVKMRYLPRRGITSDVAGIISINRMKKKVSDRRMETERVT